MQGRWLRAHKHVVPVPRLGARGTSVFQCQMSILGDSGGWLSSPPPGASLELQLRLPRLCVGGVWLHGRGGHGNAKYLNGSEVIPGNVAGKNRHGEQERKRYRCWTDAWESTAVGWQLRGVLPSAGMGLIFF